MQLMSANDKICIANIWGSMVIAVRGKSAPMKNILERAP